MTPGAWGAIGMLAVFALIFLGLWTTERRREREDQARWERECEERGGVVMGAMVRSRARLVNVGGLV